MIRRVRLAGVLGAASCGLITPAFAQNGRPATLEVMGEEERRGLSWSEGRAGLAGDLRVSLGRLDTSVRAATLRNSVRHGGADAVVDLSVGTGWDLGVVRICTDAAGHAFAGA